jgi:hypothetical protein
MYFPPKAHHPRQPLSIKFATIFYTKLGLTTCIPTLTRNNTPKINKLTQPTKKPIHPTPQHINVTVQTQINPKSPNKASKNITPTSSTHKNPKIDVPHLNIDEPTKCQQQVN